MTRRRPSRRARSWIRRTLACPGCLAAVHCEPPGYWQVRDGMPAPGFSHRDGTALCRDRTGLICDPIEITLAGG